MPTQDTPRMPLLFAHANGFPGTSYRSLLAPLAERFDVTPLERLGHHPDFPVGHNWLALRDELLDHLAQVEQPVIGVGHSMGGVLMAMAAHAAPERFRCVVMLDPPLMLGLDAWGMKAAKWLGFVDRVTPAGQSLGRRAAWPDRETMLVSLRRRGLFRRFTDQALRDYVEGGTRLLDDGQAVLLYDPAVEVEIFRHLPDHLGDLPRRLKVPHAVLAGRDSDLLTPRRRKRLARHGVPVGLVPGSHMFPMEYPDETRQVLLDTLTTLLEASP
ncbi:alpha/beta fold hydrolase [Halomonas urumqiensis]|uniref:Alpha/beta hydrolase n=1 Tax=Halomonas urumqiensis TaxID=1684789 RepID=A0A2N7UHK0_9GAMM|nr:alpha/beta hydrolase [Halomonas urumqiensis]PMR79926.1 alpha/beta hydrolase [Halomonas urumqiensis]PTB02049.1 alpha/beta hydrolase [Halomonas urumqiensis]GHE21488.1 hydrolase [Halomonas urumqiensis]